MNHAVPCCTLISGQLLASNAVQVRGEQADGELPLSECQPGLLDVRTGADRETGPAILAPAGHGLSGGDFVGCSRSAMAAVTVSVRPPHGFKPLDRGLFIRSKARTGESLAIMACKLASGGHVYPVASSGQVEVLTLDQW